MVLYANMPFDATNPRCQDGNYPNGLVSDGEINGGLSHEHMESVTDPLPNDAWTNGEARTRAWRSATSATAAEAPRSAPPPTARPYNQVINGHFYWYQQEWSNFTHSCVQRVTLPSTLPTATENGHGRQAAPT